MAIVTGDRYLDRLAEFVERQASGLLEGNLVLKVNPVGLHYVQTRLDALHELETLRAGAPVDYLRAYISDLGDHRVLEQLSRVLGLLTSLKVISVLPAPSRDPAPVTLLAFGRLKSLELRGCDLSTTAARGLLQLRPILERLVCHNSADALRHVFMERILEVKDSPVWSRLAYVSCAMNGMVLMDESLQLLPAVQSLDLTRNRFAKAGNLHRCAALKFLDLGFNHLRNISALHQIKSRLSKLILKNNALVSVHGIAALTFLEALDLSNNLISKFIEIQSLAKLPSLQILFLEGNPISSAALYREEVFSFFHDPSKVCLDGREILSSESYTVDGIKSTRLKQQALYGSYAPAEFVAEMQVGAVPSVDSSDSVLERATSFPRRKVSRLALIRDVESLLKEAAEQEESPRVLPKDGKENWQDSLPEEHDKSEAMDLMQKVEALKEEGSNVWLQDVKSLLNEKELVSEHSQNVLDPQEEIVRLTTKPGLKELQRLQKKYSRRQHRSLEKRLQDLKQERFSQELENKRHSISEKDLASLSQSSEGNSKCPTSPSDIQSDQDSAVASSRTSGTHGVSSDQDDFGGHDEEVSGGAEITKNKQDESIDALFDGQTSVDESFGSWRVIDEVVDSQEPQVALNSPPHYDEKVLQKRQALEEELLRLSYDSGCAPSSSESESSSDNSLIMASGSSRSDSESPRGMTYLKAEKSNSKLWDVWQNEIPQEQTVISNHTAKEPLPIDTIGQNMEDTEEAQSSQTKEKALGAANSHESPSCTDDIRANAGGGIGLESCEAVSKKPQKKRKPRRVPSTELYKETDGENFADSMSLRRNRSTAGSASLLTRSWVSSSCSAMQSPGKHGEPGKISSISNRVLHGSYLEPYDKVMRFFRQRIANIEEGESCIKWVQCGCIRLWEESPKERAVHILVSNKDKLYIIANSVPKDDSASGSESGLHVLASHSLQDVKKIMIGLGLQALRVDIGHEASYLILPRDVGLSREILEIFGDIKMDRPAPDFESWELKQLKVFEERVLGGSQTNIFMYLMPYFSYGNSRENDWTARSVFLTSRHLIICVEDLARFGAASSELMSSKPYFVMETAADIYDLVEAVAGFSDDCLTLCFKKTVSGDTMLSSSAKDTKSQQSTVWKFKGVLGDSALKLVSLLHAGHTEKDFVPPSCEVY